MGNKNAKIDCQQINNEQSALQQLMNNSQKPKQRLSIILANYTSSIKFQSSIKIDIKQKQLYLTKSLIQLYIHCNFTQKCLYYFNYLKDYLKILIQKKSMILINSQQWRLCFALSQFVMLCSDVYVREFMNLNNINRVKLVQNQQIQQDMMKLLQIKIQNIKPFQDVISQVQIIQATNIFRQFIYSCYTMKNKFASQFYTNFTRIFGSVQSLLNLYIKLQKNLTQRNNLRRNTYIGAYTLGIGIQYDHPATINLAIKFLLNLLKGYKYPQLNKDRKQKYDAIPQSYFKQIPKFSCKNVFQNITTYLLYILCAQTNQINSHITILLVRLMLTNFSPKNKQIVYLIEKLCETKNLNKSDTQAILQILQGFSFTQLKRTQKIRKFISANNGKVSLKEIQQQISQQGINPKEKQEKNQNDISFLYISQQINKKQIQKICHQILVTRLMPNAQIDLNYIAASKPLFKSMLKQQQFHSETRSNYPQTVTQLLSSQKKKQKKQIKVAQKGKTMVLEYQQISDN